MTPLLLLFVTLSTCQATMLDKTEAKASFTAYTAVPQSIQPAKTLSSNSIEPSLANRQLVEPSGRLLGSSKDSAEAIQG